MNNMKKPKIRFKGFTDDWEQRKVGEVIEDYVEKTTVNSKGLYCRRITLQTVR